MSTQKKDQYRETVPHKSHFVPVSVHTTKIEIPEDLEPCNRHGADGTFKNEDGKKYVEDTAGDFVW